MSSYRNHVTFFSLNKKCYFLSSEKALPNNNVLRGVRSMKDT